MELTDFSYALRNHSPDLFRPDFKLFPTSVGCTVCNESAMFFFKQNVPLYDYLFTYIVQGEFLSSDGVSTEPTVHSEAGSLLIYYPNDVFSIEPVVPNSVRLWFHVYGDYVVETLKHLNLFGTHHVKISTDSSQIIEAYENLKAAFLADDFNLVKLSSYSLLFLEKFKQNTNQSASNNKILKRIPESIKKSYKFINESYQSNLNVSDIAKKNNVSESYLIKKFKQYYQKTPYQIILIRRLELASSYLSNTDLSITDIAFYCGFNDRYHFSQSFKKHYGVSPAKYRKSYTPPQKIANP